LRPLLSLSLSSNIILPKLLLLLLLQNILLLLLFGGASRSRLKSAARTDREERHNAWARECLSVDVMGAFTEHHTVHGGRKKKLIERCKKRKRKSFFAFLSHPFLALAFFWTVDHQSVYKTSRLPHEPSDDVIITVILKKKIN
jgi:hypothetical protein